MIPFTGLVTEPEAAAALHMSRDWLARQARAKRVPHVLLGNRRYYTAEQIESIISAASSVPSEASVSARRRNRRVA